MGASGDANANHDRRAGWNSLTPHSAVAPGTRYAISGPKLAFVTFCIRRHASLPRRNKIRQRVSVQGGEFGQKLDIPRVRIANVRRKEFNESSLGVGSGLTNSTRQPTSHRVNQRTTSADDDCRFGHQESRCQSKDSITSFMIGMWFFRLTEREHDFWRELAKQQTRHVAVNVAECDAARSSWSCVLLPKHSRQSCSLDVRSNQNSYNPAEKNGQGVARSNSRCVLWEARNAGKAF